MKTRRKIRAIDLYSGVGGWSLGLRLAGIDVVASYERWGAANETNFKNNQHQAQTVDIRRLAFKELPKRIDVVVGSPPCTQFSYSNRGGSGDVDDGLRDIIKFLTIVDRVRPEFWAMENVPRVAGIIQDQLKKGGRLHKFSHLGIDVRVVDMADFGLPQRRRRCIAGNIDFDLLDTYRKFTSPMTLGQVIDALSSDPVKDPLYGISIRRGKLYDHALELPLNEEEVRINKSAKVSHPVYNSMAFPDPLNRTVRTITATCTRVSRESIVVPASPQTESVRRLTIRERASLQGFPITFQFYGASYSEKIRMIGNAIPPAFAYYVAQAIKGVQPSRVAPLHAKAKKIRQPLPPPIETATDRPGNRYPPTRNFRFAIPSLRLKSGVRFDLANSFRQAIATWEVSFWFGSSKAINSIQLNSQLYNRLVQELPPHVLRLLDAQFEELKAFIHDADLGNMQNLWSHRGPGVTRPFMLLDAISNAGERAKDVLLNHEAIARKLVSAAIAFEYGTKSEALLGTAKLFRNSALIAAGLLCGSLSNREIEKHSLQLSLLEGYR